MRLSTQTPAHSLYQYLYEILATYCITSTKSKFLYWETMRHESKVLCIAIVESHLSSHIQDSEVHVTKYIILENWQKGKRPWWSCGIKKNLHAQSSALLKFSMWNSTCIHNMIASHNLVTGNIYIYRSLDAPNHIGKAEDCLTGIKEIFMRVKQHMSVFYGWFQLPQCQITQISLAFRNVTLQGQTSEDPS